MKPKLLFALLLGWLTYGAANAQEQKGTADDICGTYYVESPVSDDAVKIQIYRATNGKYQGRFVWLSQPNNPDGTPRTDINNPDPKKRNRTADQIVAVWGLTYKDGEWVDGSIYDPTSGKTYGIKSVPSTVLIDRNGKVVARNLRGSELERKVEQLLEEPWTPVETPAEE